MKTRAILSALLIVAAGLLTQVSTAQPASALMVVPAIYNGSTSAFIGVTSAKGSTFSLAPRGTTNGTKVRLSPGFCGSHQIGANVPKKMVAGLWYYTSTAGINTVIAYRC